MTLDSPLSATEPRLITPSAPGWDAARRAWNLAVDQRPALVVLARSPDHVAATMRFAAGRGLRVAAQGTGHGAGARDLTDTILLRTSHLAGVSVDPAARTARVRAGATWGDVISVLAPHGLACLHGFAPGVGV